MPGAKRRRRKPNPPGNTTRVGLGYAHQIERVRLLAEFRDGDLCWRCGRPMRYWQQLDADHVTARALGGIGSPVRLAHAKCNRAAGSRLGNALRRQRTPRAPVRRRVSRW